MISKPLRIAAVAAFVFVANASVALAATAGDPTKVGDNVKDIVSPNAKAFWWVALVVGALGATFKRKASSAGAIGIALLVSGIVIYNPAGVGSMMQGLADKIV